MGNFRKGIEFEYFFLGINIVIGGWFWGWFSKVCIRVGKVD